MTVLYAREELAQALETGALARGRAYQLAGRVRNVTASQDGATISGTVQGERPKPYSQIIALKREGRRLSIRGTCSCPVGHNCKHVAAVLEEHLERLAETTPARSKSVQSAPPAGRGHPSGPVEVAPPLPATEGRPIGAPLTASVAQWLDRLATASGVAATAPKKPANDPRSLLFVINHLGVASVRSRDHAGLRPVVIRSRKDGSIAEEKPYDPEYATRPKDQLARYLTPDDIDILRDLVSLQPPPPDRPGRHQLPRIARHSRRRSSRRRPLRRPRRPLCVS